MGADKVVQTTDRTLAVNRPLVAAAIAPEHRFWFGLAFAAALHAALIFGVTRSSPRQIGERSGRPDGISVVLVDEADLKSKNTFREDGASAAPPAIAQPPAPPAAQPPQPKASEPPVPKQAPAPKVEAAPPAPRPRDEQKSAAQAIDKEILDSLKAPGPAPKPSDPGSAAKTPPKQEQPQQQPPLQLTMPNIAVAPGGRGAAVARPPGATRSGENDEFGRGVIRALRQTMPSPNGQLGRVTVKLLLPNTGNLAEVQLIRSAGTPGLDQSVVFAVKQASFPIPPGGATLVDRTFLVTYIYN
jgi:periplasmic protein TonB